MKEAFLSAAVLFVSFWFNNYRMTFMKHRIAAVALKYCPFSYTYTVAFCKAIIQCLKLAMHHVNKQKMEVY